MHVSLTPELEEYTRSKVSSGLYNNASEVVREALRTMVKMDQRDHELSQAVTAGFKQIEAGDYVTVSNREEFLKAVREAPSH